MTWHAGLRVPHYWNYSFQVGPGPATLSIDGKEVVTVPAGQESNPTTVSLARGDHYVVLTGTVAGPDTSTRVKWSEANSPSSTWSEPQPAILQSGMNAPRGLLATVKLPGGRADIHSIDNAIANCCLSEEGRSEGKSDILRPGRARSQPQPRVHSSMTLLAQGIADLKIDDKSVIRVAAPSDQPTGGSVDLTAGPHKVELTLQGQDGPGSIEWAWTPPGGQTSIVPPEVLSPPPGAGIGSALPLEYARPV